MRRAPRALRATLAAAAVVAVGGLSGCRTDPAVAAYVDDQSVTVDELQTAVDQHLTDPAIAAYARGDRAGFTRRVLSQLVQDEVYAVAADRYHVQVTDDQVRTRITQLLGDNDPNTVYAQLAQQGISRHDVFENVRQQIVRRQIAADQGTATGLSDAELRARYAQVRESLKKVRMGYITVPDQATADRVLAQLTADPAGYASVAGQYAGPYTLPALEDRSPDQVPSALSGGLSAAKPGTGFSVAVPETNGVVVVFVADVVYPSFEEVRGDLEKEAGDKADAAGAKVVDQVRKDLHVTINPRYGELKDGDIVPSGGGAVDILQEKASASSAPSSAPDRSVTSGK